MLKVCFAVISAIAVVFMTPHLPLSQGLTAADKFDLHVMPLQAPVLENSIGPQFTVSDQALLLSWIERDGSLATLKFSEWISDGWSAARVVASGDDWFVNWADVPSVIRLDDGTLVAHWLQKNGLGKYSYDVRLSHSINDGKTWTESFTPHHDKTPTEHGFASLFQMPSAGLGLIWLDGRSMQSDTSVVSASDDPGAMSLRFSTFDRQWTQTSEIPVDLKVCECCPTTAVMTSDSVVVAFRNRSDEEIRDIYVSRFEHGAWTEPFAVHNDGWQINGCPVNGPMLSANGDDVVVAWFNAKDNEGHAFAAFSSDAGRTFGSPIQLDERTSLGRVDIEILPDGSAIASWIEYANNRAEFFVRHIDRTGKRSSPVLVTPLMTGRSSGYPRMALRGKELFFAWTESGSLGSSDSNDMLRVSMATALLPQKIVAP